MSHVDLDRLKHLAEQGDVQAAQILHTYAARSADPSLLWYLEGVCRAQLERVSLELDAWRTLSKNFPFFAVPFAASDVVLLSHGPNKISCIKVIRELTGLGLKEAKDLSERTPCVMMHAIVPEVAADACKKLTECGATFRLEWARKEPDPSLDTP